MADDREILTFDTSALNALAKESDSARIAAQVRAQFYVRLTEANLAELVATKDAKFRAKLVDMCQRLLKSGDCVGPHHWVIEQQVKLHVQRPVSFNWQDAAVCIPALEEEHFYEAPLFVVPQVAFRSPLDLIDEFLSECRKL